MKMRLLGARNLDFKANDNSQVRGVQLFVAYASEGVVGEISDKLFLKEGFALPSCKPGDMLEITFNRKGKPETITLIGK